MGAQVSTQSSKVQAIKDIVTDVVIQNVSKCSANSTATQAFTLGDVTGDLDLSGLSMDSSVKLDVSCLSSAQNDASIMQQIAEKLKSTVEQENKGTTIGASVAVSTSLMQSITKVSNSINVSNIRNSLASAVSSQTIKIGNVSGNAVIKDVSMKMVSETVLKSISDDKNSAQAINELATQMDQSTKLTIAGLSMPGAAAAYWATRPPSEADSEAAAAKDPQQQQQQQQLPQQQQQQQQQQRQQQQQQQQQTPVVMAAEKQIRSRLRANFCVDVPGGSKDNGPQLIAWDCNNGANQKWTLRPNGHLVNTNSNKCAGVADSGTANGSRVLQWDCLDLDDQKWTLDDQGRLHPKHASQRCLNIAGGNSNNGAPLILWDCGGADHEKWDFH